MTKLSTNSSLIFLKIKTTATEAMIQKLYIYWECQKIYSTSYLKLGTGDRISISKFPK